MVGLHLLWEVIVRGRLVSEWGVKIGVALVVVVVVVWVHQLCFVWYMCVVGMVEIWLILWELGGGWCVVLV